MLLLFIGLSAIVQGITHCVQARGDLFMGLIARPGEYGQVLSGRRRGVVRGEVTGSDLRPASKEESTMKSAVIRLGAFACLLGFTIAAQAQSSVSYTNIDLTYVGADIDVGPGINDIDADGVKLAGSLNVHQYIHVLGSYERLSPDDIVIANGSNPPTIIPTDDLDTYSIGFGFHTPQFGRAERQYRSGLIDRYSLFFDAQYLGIDSGSTGASDPNGFSVDAGFRAVNSTRLETLLSVGYEKFERTDGELTVEGRIFYRVFEKLQIQGGLDWNDNTSRWFIGLRYNFPKVTIFR